MRHHFFEDGAMQRFAVMALACAMAAGCSLLAIGRNNVASVTILHEAAGRIDMNQLAALK
jgi:hypothetical protein